MQSLIVGSIHPFVELSVNQLGRLTGKKQTKAQIPHCVISCPVFMLSSNLFLLNRVPEFQNVPDSIGSGSDSGTLLD